MLVYHQQDAPPLIDGVLRLDTFVWRLTDVCLSHTSGLTREQRGLGRPKLVEVAPCHTWLGHHFQGQRSRSTGRFRPTHRGINAWGRCIGDRENVLDVGHYCYVASARRRARRPRARRGAGHIVSPRAELVVFGRLNSRVILLMFVSLLLYDLCSVLSADVSNNQWNCATNICVSIDDSLVVGKSQIKS